MPGRVVILASEGHLHCEPKPECGALAVPSISQSLRKHHDLNPNPDSDPLMQEESQSNEKKVSHCIACCTGGTRGSGD